jgi:hypothetical protein
MRGSLLARFIFCTVMGAGLVAARLALGIPYEVMQAGMFAALLAILIGGPLGWLVGWCVSRDSDVDTTPFKVVAGANLVAWAVPVVGMALGVISLQFSKRSDGKRIYYWVLGAIGAWGAIANAGIGGAHEMQMRQIRAQALEIGGVVDSGERSRARCAYAAREVWSAEDFERYCR